MESQDLMNFTDKTFMKQNLMGFEILSYMNFFKFLQSNRIKRQVPFRVIRWPLRLGAFFATLISRKHKGNIATFPHHTAFIVWCIVKSLRKSDDFELIFPESKEIKTSLNSHKINLFAYFLFYSVALHKCNLKDSRPQNFHFNLPNPIFICNVKGYTNIKIGDRRKYTEREREIL